MNVTAEISAMGKLFETITDDLAAWIARQRMFFVATAPRSDEGHINCSPRGLDTLRVLGPLQVGWLDLTGSGVETIAHLRENGRIVLMFCAFEGPPRIVRLHGRGRVIRPGEPDWQDLRPSFPVFQGERALIVVDLTRISDSCGYAVPRMDFVEDRDQLTRSAARRTRDEIAAYQAEHNATSLDGLPAMDPTPRST